jgi:predicted short-subunit dehydrogenase-like oxidoreductase (DUF2520 family)
MFPKYWSSIRAIADRLSEKVVELNSEQRKALHVAAVFACNFTNHLFGLAQELLEEKGTGLRAIETPDKRNSQ